MQTALVIKEGMRGGRELLSPRGESFQLLQVQPRHQAGERIKDEVAAPDLTTAAHTPLTLCIEKQLF